MCFGKVYEIFYEWVKNQNVTEIEQEIIATDYLFFNLSSCWWSKILKWWRQMAAGV